MNRIDEENKLNKIVQLRLSMRDYEDMRELCCCLETSISDYIRGLIQMDLEIGRRDDR